MTHVLNSITWIGQSAEWEVLLERIADAVITPLKGGLEAEVYRISLPETELVCKIWNRESKPDVALQYKILEHLYRQGLAVSRPYAWGSDQDHNQVLLTSFDGLPAKRITPSSLTAMAQNLLDIHNFQIGSLSRISVPVHKFADYFFPEWAGQPQIRALALELAEKAGMTSHHLIHGDYHTGNILEAAGAYTIIDWTNVQLGDPRYDIAWSVALIRIYASERYAGIYRSAFIAKSTYSEVELELFAAMAYLRWLQLHRTTGIPLGRGTLSRVRTLLQQNEYLPDTLL